MSSLRDLVAGSDMCTPSDGAGPSNALGGLVNTLLGGAGKAQEQLRELPGMGPGGAGPSSFVPTIHTPSELAMAGPGGLQIPGLGPPRMDNAAAESFLQGIHGPSYTPVAGVSAAPPAEWDAIFHGKEPRPVVPVPLMPPPAAPPLAELMPRGPPPMLAPHFQAFVRSALAPGAAASAAGPLPPELAAQLSVADKVRIRDRSTIMARHLYADQGDKFADMQVDHLLASLRIDPRELPAQLNHVHHADWHDAWRAAAGAPPPSVAAELAAAGGAAAQLPGGPAPWDAIWEQRHGPAAGPGGPATLMRPPSTGWATEFAAAQAPQQPAPASWATEFAASAAVPAAAETTASTWAADFKQEQDQSATTATDQQQGQQVTRGSAGDTRATSAALAAVLSQASDPKMRNSKFLQFVSKMSKGELILEDNKVVERRPEAASWAAEFAGQQQGTAAAPSQWAAEFAGQRPGVAGPAPSSAAIGRGGEWVEEFSRGVSDLRLDEGLDASTAAQLEAAWRDGEASSWAQEFNKGDEQQFEEWERMYGHGAVEDSVLGGGLTAAMGPGAAPGEYVFSENNPFLGDLDAQQKGKDLFRRGILSEAALALEAEVRAHPENAEAWRLLGTVHAENDDDRQAIAAMMRAHTADPRDPEVLLALGVSHTNELSQWEAVKHLRSWLAAQPPYSALDAAAGEAPDTSQRLTHVIRLFESAASQAPSDPELHVALGVLHHLGRQYGAAVAAFHRALELRPSDYSLWNKLGATLANNGRSGEALAAYQKALDLKPNYMRAWTNMGISYSNLGEYIRSAAFYVRALGLNAAADHVWGYLRTALACSGKLELLAAVDSKDLATLQAALPLE
ncbi:hypothetical protein Vretimale_176 [Volvox reticuliferus]|uniref:Peroxin-5 n=1 Tax=Volvox reticuliferus TaxID=1737510 RepID=A0A8J4CC33_9CHLO|nr:hypothetical protein Vretifemale_8250 [Volvox reticuliferus]GIL93944.1 hypothetical protein Vretimale_176 [Volvox reticuliferus]